MYVYLQGIQGGRHPRFHLPLFIFKTMEYFSNATATKVVKLNAQPGRTSATLTDERSHQKGVK